MTASRIFFLTALVGSGALAHSALAVEGRSCSGPPECCPSEIADRLPESREVEVGVSTLGIYNVNEKAGSWDADYYLYESWLPAPGFTPQTEIVNEISHQATPFDDVEFHNGRCTRWRRMRSTLKTRFNLRLSPFDHQLLQLELSDAEYDAAQVHYRVRPASIEDSAREQLSSWKLLGEATSAHATRAFHFEDGSPDYDYATFTIPVRRHITYHLTRFFLPLFIIVAVAFSVFWVTPTDLSSQVGLGVTCLLAAIAFQLAEGNTLPEVAYLSLADRVYAWCYTAIALALIESIWTAALAHRGEIERALAIDRGCRWAFPLALAGCLTLSTVVAVIQSHA